MSLAAHRATSVRSALGRFTSLRSIVTALAITLGAVSSGALAVGRVADINVVDRDTGQVLPVYQHQGRHYVAGRPGARYAVRVHNRAGGRVMTVVAVDGVNVVSGDTASWEQNGYVLSPWQRHDIAGWRKSQGEVAAFEFTALPNSYAARTGRPENAGVIGVAVFRERYVAPPAPPVQLPAPQPRPYGATSGAGGAGARDSASSASGAGITSGNDGVARDRSQADARGGASSQAAGNAAGPRAESPAMDSAPAPAAAPAAARKSSDAIASAESRAASPSASRPALQPDAKLGTGHGAREPSWVQYTTFERASAQPDDVITIYYDSRDNLIAQGVIPAPRVYPAPPAPQPFPATPQLGYVPDPPRL